MMKMITNGSNVKLYDFYLDEEVIFHIVKQTYKTHYMGFSFDRDGNYNSHSIQVLASGGNGLDTISLESRLGTMLAGKQEGDIIEYTAEDGTQQKFNVLQIW